VTSTGQIVVSTDNNTDIMLERFNANGSVDTTFGTGGQVSTPLAAGSSNENTLIQQPDGKLVLSGGTAESLLVLRYNASGSLDTTFGSGGVATSAVGAGAYAYGAALYSNGGTVNDGKIVVTGFTSPVGYPANREWLIERYNPNGTLDSTFGSGGEVITPNPGEVESVVVAADGKLVVQGWSGSVKDLARYNAEGNTDSTFGSGGVVPLPFGETGAPLGQRVAMQSNGDIVVVGCGGGPQETFAVARLLPSEPEIGSFTASPNPVTSGSSTTLTATNITDLNPGATVKQVAFYVQVNGTNTLLGYGTQSSPSVWTFSYMVSLAPGTYTLFAQAQDSDGVLGDLAPLTLTVQ
jgi:uncharacterized delta-60 repeat protein